MLTNHVICRNLVVSTFSFGRSQCYPQENVHLNELFTLSYKRYVVLSQFAESDRNLSIVERDLHY